MKNTSVKKAGVRGRVHPRSGCGAEPRKSNYFVNYFNDFAIFFGYELLNKIQRRNPKDLKELGGEVPRAEI